MIAARSRHRTRRVRRGRRSCPLETAPRCRSRATAQLELPGARPASSSGPSNPSSPACGFNPASARRGRVTPNRGSSRAVRSMMSPSSVRVRSRGTAASGTWTVASTTFNGSDQNIIATRGACVRCASRSVCPFHGSPRARKGELVDGRRRDGGDPSVNARRAPRRRWCRTPRARPRPTARRARTCTVGRAVDHRLAHRPHARIVGRLPRRFLGRCPQDRRR